MDVSRLRQTAEKFMPSELVITRYTYPLDPDTGQPLTDAYGDPYEPTAETTTTKCKLSGLTSKEEVTAGRLSSSATAKLSVPHDTDIGASATVTVDGERWNVSGVMPRSPEHRAHKVVLVARAE